MPAITTTFDTRDEADGLADRLASLWHGVRVVVGASVLTLGCFLVLPLMETISSGPVADLPPPPPPMEPEPEQEPEPDEQPPQLEENSAPLDLSQLELALNPGMGGDWGTADFAVKLSATVSPTGGGDDGLFSLADLDQKPRAIYQPMPQLDAQLRKKAPGSVHVIFVVDQKGKVEDPRVQSATDPAFERPALAAVKQWKFEPGKRQGQPVRFRMRVPITFPKN
jgi:protein TonB